MTPWLREIANRHAGGRLLVPGGGGHEKANLGPGWCAVVEALPERGSVVTPPRSFIVPREVSYTKYSR